MKPITDEIVVSLIERAERRQGTMRPANDMKAGTRPDVAARIISLDLIRRCAKARETVTGVFCYAPRA